jgi:CRP-like cAMP-binding protein
MDEPVTRAEVNRLIAKAFAAERKIAQQMLSDFADQLNLDLEKIVLSLTTEIGELNRTLAELRRIQNAPLDKPLPPPPQAH